MTGETRAQAVADAVRQATFPAEITIGNAMVRLSRPRRVAPNAVSFRAVVSVDGKVVDRDEHIIVNPNTMVEDDAGEVVRVRKNKDGSETTKRFRPDPLAAAARSILQAAQQKIAGR